MKNILIIYLLVISVYFGLLVINSNNIIINHLSHIQKQTIYILLCIFAIYFIIEDNIISLFTNSKINHEKVKEHISQQKNNTIITLQIPDNNISKIIYWVSFKDDLNKSTVGSFENSGIADVINGSAVININCSTKYNDGVSRYVHYRTINNDVLSDVIIDSTDILSKCN